MRGSVVTKMKIKYLSILCLIVCSAALVHAQVRPKAPTKPVTTQTATTGDGRSVILKSDGTWTYESTGPSSNLATLTGKCRFQLVAGFFPCDPKVIYAQLATGVSHLTFVKTEKGKQILFTLSGRSDRQPNLENYYLQIDTVSMDGFNSDGATDNGMEGECHFRMNKAGTNFFSIKCDVYNRSKGSLYNFYLENITKTQREILK